MLKYPIVSITDMEEDKTTKYNEINNILFEPRNIGEIDPHFLEKAFKFCEGYKKFLTNKTEREIIEYIIPILKENGYSEYALGNKYKPGDKFYKVNRNKTIMMCTWGKRPLIDGVRVAVAHIDSPRLDLKPHPVFEESEMVYLKTHYYGGIKKYQWTTIPLSIHGVISLVDGSLINIRIGEKDDEPSFCIADLLPHLAQNQMKKIASDIIEGEQMNILIGSWPYSSSKDAKDRVKLAIMNMLFEKYGIKESDFESAEICAVPAFKARDMGLDRSMIASYGQDDSSCAYAEFMAEIDTKQPQFTTITIFADKEETGSDGVTGMRSFFFRDFIEDLAQCEGYEVRHILQRSICLSCDVGSAYDPNFEDVYDKSNCQFINHGPVISKYNGSRGKYGTNDASCEMMSYILNILRNSNIIWQMGELGKIDIGGGGTIASEISVQNIDTVDIGVPVLSMHAPLEVTSKSDVYMLYKAIHAVYNSDKSKCF